jgi:hypothetical protein
VPAWSSTAQNTADAQDRHRGAVGVAAAGEQAAVKSSAVTP